MKHYDYAKTKAFIDKNQKIIESASLGFNEDWFWTAETIYENGKYQKDLTEEGLTIGGIDGSMWATPTLEVTYFDGATEKIEVSRGEFDAPITDRIEREMFVKGGLGCMSKPLQENRGDIDYTL